MLFPHNTAVDAMLPKHPLLALRKEEPGSPVPMVPQSPVNSFPHRATPPVWFPQTVGDLHAITIDQIYALAVFYNDTFGIQDPDDAATKRAKFVAWIAC